MRHNSLVLILLFILISCSSDRQDKVVISTKFGEMEFRLSQATPLHKSNFITQVEAGRLSRGHFNRLVHNFVIQGGCPDKEDGSIDAEKWIPAEFQDSLRHVFGALGMGRDDNREKQSADCQFYIVTNPHGLQRLDGRYTVFGRITRGLDVLQALNTHALKNGNDSVAFEIGLVR